jgi:alanine racemase
VRRSLSNQGFAWLGGRAERVVGTVSMDLTALSAQASTKPGDWAELLGPRVDIWAQARAAGTIPYELLTGISPRVKRDYGA